MDQDILTELKKINSQLVQITQLLRTSQPGPRPASQLSTMAHSNNDIASEVQRQIAEARRRAEESMSGLHSMLPNIGE